MKPKKDGYDGIRETYKPTLTSSQVAELLDLNPRTVLNMAADGRLPARRLPDSRKFIFILEELIDLLKQSEIKVDQ